MKLNALMFLMLSVKLGLARDFRFYFHANGQVQDFLIPAQNMGGFMMPMLLLGCVLMGGFCQVENCEFWRNK